MWTVFHILDDSVLVQRNSTGFYRFFRQHIFIELVLAHVKLLRRVDLRNVACTSTSLQQNVDAVQFNSKHRVDVV